MCFENACCAQKSSFLFVFTYFFIFIIFIFFVKTRSKHVDLPLSEFVNVVLLGEQAARERFFEAFDS